MTVNSVQLPILVAFCALLAQPTLAGENEPPPPNQPWVSVGHEWGSPTGEAHASLGPTQAAGAPVSLTAIPVWAHAGFGEGIGKSKIRLGDDLGVTEVYLGGSTTTFGDNDYWFVLRHDPASGGYTHVFLSPWYESRVRRIELAHVVGDAAREIVVALGDGRVLFHDLTYKSVIGEIDTIANDVKGLQVADVDTDGTPEVVVSNRDRVFVYDPDGTLEWRHYLDGGGGDDLVVGQLDGDLALEIAVTDGVVVDGVTRDRQWEWASGFGRAMEVVDVDADGIQELVAAERDHDVWCYDVDLQLPKWSVSVSGEIDAIHVAEVDADPALELLVGEGQTGEVIVFDTATGQQQWSIENPASGVTDIAVGDTNGDGQPDLLWGAGATSSGIDRLYVADVATQEIVWENLQLDGPFIGPKMGDLDGDGVPEIVVASQTSDAGYGSGRIVVFDAGFRQRAVSDEVAGGLSRDGLFNLKLIDVDADGRLEILIAADLRGTGVVEIYDFDADDSLSLAWRNESGPDGSPFRSVDADDVDGDGVMEIVAGGSRASTGAPGVFVYVYDYATARLEWNSLQMGGFWGAVPDLAIADLDGDGALEIAGRLSGGDVYVFDGATGALEAIVPGRFQQLKLVGSAATPVWLLSTTDGEVVLVAHLAGAYEEVYRETVGTEPINGVHLGWGGASLWTASAGRLQLSLPTTLSWQSEDYSYSFGRDVLFYPGYPLLVSAGRIGVVAFWVSTP